MMAVTLCVCLWLGWLIANLAPKTPIGRACQDWLVDKPAAWMSKLTLRRAVYLACSSVLIAVFFAYLMPVMSAEVALLLAGDMLAYVELLAAVTVMAIRSGSIWPSLRVKVNAVGSRLASMLRRGARQRGSTTPRRRMGRLDPLDEGEPAFLLA